MRKLLIIFWLLLFTVPLVGDTTSTLDFYKFDVIQGVYICGYLHDVNENFSLENFSMGAGYVFDLGGDILGATDLTIDTENGITGLGGTVFLPVKQGMWVTAGADILELAVSDGNFNPNNTMKFKPGFMVLLSKNPIGSALGNSYLALFAQYTYRTPVHIGYDADQESVYVEKDVDTKSLWVGMALYFE